MKHSDKEGVLKRLSTAYEEILQHALEEYRDFRQKNYEDKSSNGSFIDSIQSAKEKLIRRGEVTEDEAFKLSEYLKRDLQESVAWMNRTGKEMGDWFGYEASIIKAGLLEMFIEAADQTKVDMIEFQHELEEGGQYHSGQYTAPGVLVCEKCAEKIHFTEVGRVPPCPRCKGGIFFREE